MIAFLPLGVGVGSLVRSAGSVVSPRVVKMRPRKGRSLQEYIFPAAKNQAVLLVSLQDQ